MPPSAAGTGDARFGKILHTLGELHNAQNASLQFVVRWLPLDDHLSVIIFPLGYGRSTNSFEQEA